MAGRSLTSRPTQAQLYSPVADSGVAGLDPVPGESGARANGAGQPDTEAERKCEHQAGASGQRCAGGKWQVDAAGVGGGRDRRRADESPGPADPQAQATAVAASPRGTVHPSPTVDS